jgi:hypothetical protein
MTPSEMIPLRTENEKKLKEIMWLFSDFRLWR